MELLLESDWISVVISAKKLRYWKVKMNETKPCEETEILVCMR